MIRRALSWLSVIGVLTLAACSNEEPRGPYEVEEAALTQIAADLASGKTTAAEVTKGYIDRINRYDAPLRAVIAIEDDALQQAAASDARRKDGKTLGRLDGIPILFKDNIDIAGLPTTAGSFALERNVAAQDSEVVKRLRAAGAIILGKTNLSQFAGWRSVAVFNGSTVGHAPHNPYNLERSPAGSSSGSGIAAAVSFAAATVGTDTTGSIVGPSSVNGVVGMRPTVGLISRRGIVPLSLTMDTAGPMARSVADLAAVLTAIAGSDPADVVTSEADTYKSDYTKALDDAALEGKRLGVVRGTRGYDEFTEPLLEEAIKVIRAQGAEVIELPHDLIEDLNPETLGIMSFEFKEDIAAYLASAPPAQVARTLPEIITVNSIDPRENMHDQEALEMSQARGGRQDEEYKRMLAYAKRRAGPDGYGRAFKEFGVSAVIGVTAGPGGRLVADRTLLERSSNIATPKGTTPPSISGNAAIAGYPNISVPMGLVEDMPVGLSLVGPPWSEALLISYAYDYEQASKRRVPPQAYKAGFQPRRP
ncbi:MAG: amidase family protein [Rhodospirillaceae bacterium]